MKARDLDRTELLEFQPARVALEGRRLILHDLHALAQFRRDLIESLGLEEARRILTRKGFFWGQADAAAMQRMYRWDSLEEWLQACAVLKRIQGLSDATMEIRGLDLGSGRVDIELRWTNSSESEQHRWAMGSGDAPACWALAAYAGGYVSHCLGSNIYFIEKQCQAAGDPECVVIGRDAASWGRELEPYVAYFHAPDLPARMAALEERLALQRRTLERQRQELRRRSAPATAPGLQLPSAAFRRTLELAERVAKFDSTVLITGETGSGKEILARHLHERSPRAGQPLLAVNCSALPETLLETELFGHRQGAFTGATHSHRGLFEEAAGGTVFLDEIGDVSPALQAKLLRVLQEKEIRRVGEPRPRSVNVRVLSATNHDLEARVAAGSFRRDLFYRLNVVRLQVPPLRERRDDILPLARLFLKRCGGRQHMPGLRLDPASVQVLLDYAWPGNVRELENAIEHAAVMCSGGLITPECLPLRPLGGSGNNQAAPASRSLAEVESLHIRQVLESTGGNRAAAARILGIGEATLYRRLRPAR